MMHICVIKITTMGSDDGLSPGRRQAIIWTNAGILLIGPLGTNFSQLLIKIYGIKSYRISVSGDLFGDATWWVKLDQLPSRTQQV